MVNEAAEAAGPGAQFAGSAHRAGCVCIVFTAFYLVTGLARRLLGVSLPRSRTSERGSGDA